MTNNTYRVSWEVDIESETVYDAAIETALTYFQPRVARGEYGSACVFQVKRHGHPMATEVDLSKVESNASAEQLRKMFGEEGHPEHRKDIWQRQVANDDTVIGYWEWVMHRIEERMPEEVRLT